MLRAQAAAWAATRTSFALLSGGYLGAVIDRNHRAVDARTHRERLRRAAVSEFAAFHPWLLLGNGLARLIPDNVGIRARVAVLRAIGWDIGPRTLLAGTPRFRGPGRIQDRLQIGADNLINIGCVFELHDQITTGERVSLGHEVLFLTTSHHVGRPTRRAGPSVRGPIVIGAGAWIGARSVILPGVTVGEGAVVAAASVVTNDVNPHTLVAGAPASVLVKRLPR
jgi:acetyltransferase-like isoleucine patch superfamily enzyme